MRRGELIDIAATVAYAGFLVVILLSPVNLSAQPRGQFLNEETTVGDFFKNVALFVPLGIGLGRRGRRLSLNRLRVIILVAAATFVFSFTIETVQYLLLPMRCSSIFDAVGDMLGAALGAWWASRHK
jgi:glycopeptide antibiotics resistance protein